MASIRTSTWNQRSGDIDGHSPRQRLPAARPLRFLRAWGLASLALAVLAAAPAPRSGAVNRGPATAVAKQTDAAARVEATFQLLADLLQRPAGRPQSELEREAEGILADAFAIDAMAAEILGNRWLELRETEQAEFREALTRGLRIVILPYLQSLEEWPRLQRGEAGWKVDGGSTRADYRLVTSERAEDMTLLLSEVDGTYRIRDVQQGERTLLGSLGDRVRRDLHDYSFPYMVAMLGGYPSMVFDDFEDDDPGGLPAAWTVRKQDRDKNKPYRVRVENGNRYLEATDAGESVILGKEVGWNLDEFPYVSFRVRVHRIPEGGDERDDHKVDSAAGIYVTLNKKFFGKIPESVKYVWSSTLPVGTAVRRRGIGRPWQVVFGSGEEGLGEWHTFVFDLRAAYEDTFGGEAPSRSVGIGVLSDANSLHAEAWADYDDIRALRTAPPGTSSGVTQIVPPIGSS